MEEGSGTVAISDSNRVKSSRVEALDGIRAYAILGIVAVHLLGVSGVLDRADGTDLGVFIWGLLGSTVDAFFMISAFVLFIPAVRRGGEFGGAVSFWIKRGARLFPALWLVLAITLVLAIVHPPLPGYTLPGPGEIFGNFAALQMPAAFVSAGFRIGFGINGPLWLVSVVVGFYAVLPFVAKAYYRHALIGLAIAALITVCWKEVIGRDPELLLPFTNGDVARIQLLGVDQLPSWAFSLGLGMTGAWAYVRANERWSREHLQRFATLALPVALLLYVIAGYVRGRYALDFGGNVPVVARSHPFETLFESFSRAALIAVVVIGPFWMQRPFANRPTARLSELSYGIYLIHYVVILYVADLFDLPRAGTFGDFLIWTAVILPPSLAFSYASRRWVELPVIARVKAWQTRRDGNDTAPIHVPAAAAD